MTKPNVPRYLAVALLLAGAAAADGIATGRWSGAKADYSIPALPLRFGDWLGQEMTPGTVEPKVVNVTRSYTHAKTGKTMIISLSNGPPGLTGIHTPDYCYTGSGYEMAEPIRRRGVNTRADQMFTTVFRKGTNDSVRICWAWKVKSKWVAPSMPRMAALGQSHLFKLYVVTTDPATENPDLDAFLEAFLGELDPRLIG